MSTYIIPRDGAFFHKVPLRIRSGIPSLSISASLAPFIAFDISVSAGTEAGLAARLTQTTPSLALALSPPGGAVNSACEPVGDADYAFFATAYTVNASMGLATSARVAVNDAGAAALARLPGLDAVLNWEATLFSYSLPWLDGAEGSARGDCYVVADDASPTATASAGQDQHPAPTGTLLAAAAAVPTYNISKIEAYYSSHGNTYPPGISYQMLAQSGQQVPDTLKASGARKSVTSHFYSFAFTAVCIVASVAILV